eukprot:gene11202-18820_t
MATIYELVKGASGKIKYAEPFVQFQYGSAPNYTGPMTRSCVPQTGTVPDAYMEHVYNNTAYTFRGAYTPCVNGTQQFVGYKYPGLITQHPTGTENYGIKGKWKVPVNMHIGNIGLTPKNAVPVTSTAPFDSGGNLDNRRLGAGSTLYLRAEVAGGLLAMGDTHMAQGDSEFDGTAIETSINGKFKITLHKAGTGPKKVHNLTFPLIENAENYIVQGLAYNNYLNHPDLQPNPQQLVLQKGSSLDKAMNNTYLKAREWLMNAKNLTEDEVNTFITVMCDFQVTQVVDGNWGVHLVIPKFAFQKNTKPHNMMPKVVCGTSTLQNPTPASLVFDMWQSHDVQYDALVAEFGRAVASSR